MDKEEITTGRSFGAYMLEELEGHFVTQIMPRLLMPQAPEADICRWMNRLCGLVKSVSVGRPPLEFVHPHAASLRAFLSAEPHQGFVHFCEVVQNTPKSWRQKAAKLVAMKCTLLARTDAYGQDPSGETGKAMKAEVQSKVRR